MKPIRLPNPVFRLVSVVLATVLAMPGPMALGQAFTNPYPVVILHTVNDGSTQRSVVTNLALTFNTNVSLVTSNLVLRHLQNGNIHPTNFALAYDTLSNKATFTFPGLPGRTLPDGNYIASLLANTVSNAAGQHLDGNNDGQPGDPYVFDFFRYFGDWNGDRDVDFLDNYWFQKSREADAPIPLRSIFDDNGRGPNDAAATAHFRSNYFTLLPAQPSIFAALVNDTGFNPWDNITTDATIAGTVIKTNPAAAINARTDSSPNWTDLNADLGTDGSFRLAESRLGQINGSPLPIGTNTIHFRLQETSGFISATFDLTFVLESTGTCTFTNGWIAQVTQPSSLLAQPVSGSVQFTNCEIFLTEGDSFLVTVARDLQLPASAANLSITYSQLSFDPATTNKIKDAFEIALVDDLLFKRVTKVRTLQYICAKAADMHASRQAVLVE